MTKSVTLITVAVTTVVLLTLAGTVYAYNALTTTQTTSNATNNQQTISSQSNSQQLVSSSLVVGAPNNTPAISPQDAASIAVKFSNRTDLYSIELADFNGSQAYKLTFTTGDVIYIAMNGQVVGSAPSSQAVIASSQTLITSPTTPIPPAIIYTGPVKKLPSGGNNGGNSYSGEGGGGGGGGGDGGGGD